MRVPPIWWRLPGPRQFVESIVEAVRDGRCVIIGQPRHQPRGLGEAVRSEVASLKLPWVRVRREDCGVEPSKRIAAVYGDQSPPLLRPHEMAERLCGKASLLWIECDAQEDGWPAWHEFVLEYSETSRHHPLHERVVLVLSVLGGPPDDTIQCGPSLIFARWCGVVDMADALVFSSTLVRARTWSPLERTLRTALVAHLSQWDPVTMVRLASMPTPDLMRPHDSLRALGRERGWNGRDAPSWVDGSLEEFEGSQRIHSAVCGKSFVDLRLWGAEVGVLLPHLEERRRQLVDLLRDQLRVPFKTRHGYVDRVQDLEVGHIDSQIKQYDIGLPVGSRRDVDYLRQARNALSHMEPLEELDLEALEFNWRK
jgi:hypothetical protein